MSLPETPLVQETILKRRRSLDELAYRRTVAVSNLNHKPKKVRGDLTKIKRPEQYVKEFLNKEISQNKLNRKKRKLERMSSKKLMSTKSKSTVGFMVRIKEGHSLSGGIQSQLRQLKLNNLYDGQFVNLTEELIRKLQPLEDYIVYGYLSKRSVVELVHRRAFTNINGELQPLSDNLSVEKYLGDKGIICLNDLSDEIYRLGPNFDDAISILCPFKLSAPLGSYEKKILNNKDEMEMKGGYLCDEMDTFLQKIL